MQLYPEAQQAYDGYLLLKQAGNRFELGARDKPEGMEEELLPGRGITGNVVDVLFGANTAKLRAGRATAMAESMGDKPSWLLSQPTLTNTGSIVAGLLAGYGGAKALGAYAASRAEGIGKPVARFAGGWGGKLIGAPIGALAGRSLLQHFRNKEIEGIKERYREHEDQINPTMKRPGFIHLPGAYHLMGQVEGVEALRDGYLDHPLTRLGAFALLSGKRGQRRQRFRTRHKAKRRAKNLSRQAV